ncbi:MAG: hypothetical protein WKF75_20170 [Singulisphaera sp.]
MKPGRRDIRHKVPSPATNRELKRHADSLVEAFGLDRKIEAYKGTRPLTLYRCIGVPDGYDDASSTTRGGPRQDARGLALKRLGASP